VEFAEVAIFSMTVQPSEVVMFSNFSEADMNVSIEFKVVSWKITLLS
tara:strand:- start:4222 stop:4362 length:141 start_codon:yes stop_codon:yes gene_type:complete